MIKSKLKRVSDFVYEIPKEGDMKVPGRLFLSPLLLKDIEESALKQIVAVSKLPGVVGSVVGMSDMHVGYGFPIGGVAAFDVSSGAVSPGGVGYDINCSVRLVRTNLTKYDLQGREEALLASLCKAIPTGVGCKGDFSVSEEELDDILRHGASWMVERGYGDSHDLRYTEEHGRFKGAFPKDVSKRAKERGITQLGTLGAGNHFLDVLVVDELFDTTVANAYGLKQDQVVILIHCGSRGLGHQVASDYIRLCTKEYGALYEDRALVGAPITSELGKKYLSAMACAANFAFANKQLITHSVRETLQGFFKDFEAEVVYDICHNIAKFETHAINGTNTGVLVLRKGATRSLGAGASPIPNLYKQVGAPIFLPGSMGTPSYVLCGTNGSAGLSFSSTAHGAGRAKSRRQAKQERTFEAAKQEMRERRVFVASKSHAGLVEEFPDSYKDIDEVVRVSSGSGIAKKVAKLTPVLVVIG